MEDKKKLILQVMNKLLPYWDLAESIIALVNSKYMDEKAIDGLLVIISESIKNSKKTLEKSKLQKASKAIKKIKETEKLEKKEENKEIESMLSDI